MDSKTGSESPQSINITLYYKGFSMQVTKRDPDISVKDLVQEAMNGIDWAITQGLKPSWNDETNRTALGEQKKSVSQAPGETDPTNEWLDKGVAPKDSRPDYCFIHKVAMKEKNGKFGVFYSHWLGKDSYGKSTYCNGKQK